jgi:hypothetical protein
MRRKIDVKVFPSSIGHPKARTTYTIRRQPLTRGAGLSISSGVTVTLLPDTRSTNEVPKIPEVAK